MDQPPRTHLHQQTRATRLIGDVPTCPMCCYFSKSRPLSTSSTSSPMAPKEHIAGAQVPVLSFPDDRVTVTIRTGHLTTQPGCILCSIMWSVGT